MRSYTRARVPCLIPAQKTLDAVGIIISASPSQMQSHERWMNESGPQLQGNTKFCRQDDTNFMTKKSKNSNAIKEQISHLAKKSLLNYPIIETSSEM